MERQQAIAVLYSIKSYVGIQGWDDDHVEAMKMAISALEQQVTPAEIEALKAKLQKVERERRQLGIALDKAIEKMRNMGWCAGCKHFKGLNGCGLGKLSECDDNNDLYVFFGLEDTTCE